QHLTVVGTDASSVDGAIPPAVSPDLTATAPHYAFGWSPDAGVQGVDIAVRVAAARAALFVDTPQKNWNGFQIIGSARPPILLAPTVPSPDALNTALRTYALFPVVKGPSGNLEITKGRTTSLAQDKRLWAWSSEAQAAHHSMIDLPIAFAPFKGGSILRYSE